MKYKLTCYCTESRSLDEYIYFSITSSDIQVIIDSILGRTNLRFTLEEIE